MRTRSANGARRLEVGARQQHDELLAADAGGDIDPARLHLEQRAEPHQHTVAELVPVARR